MINVSQNKSKYRFEVSVEIPKILATLLILMVLPLRSIKSKKYSFNCRYRGKLYAKNKGEIDMYYVDGLNI